MRARIPILRAALILASILAVYWQALGGGFLWDDDVYVTANAALRSPAGLAHIWKIPPSTRQYYPVTFTAFWLEYRLWADSPFGYRLVNLLLHAANALLVWRLLRRLEVRGAFVAAWIFAVHPVHVESVAWITELKNVLAGLFSLLAALAWLHHLDDRRRSGLLLSALCFALALLSKTQVCGLPLILLLLTWWKRPERLRQALLPLAALAVIGLAGGLTTVWFEAGSGEVLYPMPRLSPLDRVLVAGRALWFYVVSFFWPARLRAIYGNWSVAASDPLQLLAALSAAAALAATWAARKRIGKAPFVGLASYVVCLAPGLGFVDFHFMRFAFVADHFAYLASIPLIALAVAAAARATELLPRSIVPRLRAAAACLVVAALGAIAAQRSLVHDDAERLWRDNIERDPRAATAYNHLGTVLYNRGRVDEAIEAFRSAASIDPALADPQHNLGLALQRQGRLDEAMVQYAAALRLRPDSRVVRNSMGVTSLAKGDQDAAIAYFSAAIERDPGYAPAHNNWGAVLFQRGEYESARAHFETAARLDPDYAEAQDNWGVALAALGRPEEAISHFTVAVELDPRVYAPYRHWGDALVQLRRYEPAIDRYRNAIRIDPSRAAAHRGLGTALLELGRTKEAIAELNVAVSLDGSEESRRQLGTALARDAGMAPE